MSAEYSLRSDHNTVLQETSEVVLLSAILLATRKQVLVCQLAVPRQKSLMQQYQWNLLSGSWSWKRSQEVARWAAPRTGISTSFIGICHSLQIAGNSLVTEVLCTLCSLANNQAHTICAASHVVICSDEEPRKHWHSCHIRLLRWHYAAISQLHKELSDAC